MDMFTAVGRQDQNDLKLAFFPLGGLQAKVSIEQNALLDKI